MHPSAPQNFPEPELLAASLQGDVGAYTRLVERYQGLVWSVALCVTGDESVAEELAQEAFITAWNRLPELRDLTRFRSWLCGIVRNHARTARRHAERHIPDLGRRSELVDTAADRPTPLDHIIDGEQQRQLSCAIDELPDSYREPLVLFYGEQLPVREIAELLEVSEQTVRQRLSRGRRQLRVGIAAAVASAILVPATRAAAIAVPATRAAAVPVAASGWVPAAIGVGAVAAIAAAIALFVAAGATSNSTAATTAPGTPAVAPAAQPALERSAEPRRRGSDVSGVVEMGRGNVDPNREHPAQPSAAPVTRVAPAPGTAPPARVAQSSPKQPARDRQQLDAEVRHGPAVIERPLMRPSISLDDIR